MKRELLVVLCVVLNGLLVSLNAQEKSAAKATTDTIPDSKSVLLVPDSLTSEELKQFNEGVEVKLVEEFQPNSTKAVIYSAIFPGLGQIYNKKYWKLPIIYGGFFGVVYAVSWNGNMYNDYRNGYRDLMSPNYLVETRWRNLVSDPTLVENDSALRARYIDRFKRNRDTFRRNRDLAIIIGVGLYALCMIDAYVDAQLYNFTVTPDVSMTMGPVVWGPSVYSNSVAFGLQCNIQF